MDPQSIEQLVARTTAVTDGRTPNPRAKQVLDRLLTDLYTLVEDLDVTPDEFWTAVSYLTEAGQAGEYGLLAAGLGFEHLLDLRMDEAEQQMGIEGGTPRTIEGPLYIAGAPESDAEARLDDGTEDGQVLLMQGQVLDTHGAPLAGAVVDVWHANLSGMYSHFDPSQVPFNLRRRIRVDDNGRYRFRTLVPSGYGCPPGGPTERLLDLVGRHAQRPAHIHFLVTAPGHRSLTTQINIAGDPLVHDDFAFATRDDLIPDLIQVTEPARIAEANLTDPYAEIVFDFTLHADVADAPSAVVIRQHAEAIPT